MESVRRGSYRRAQTVKKDEAVDIDSGENVKVKKSTWANLWPKFKVLRYYLWPSGNRLHQSRVVLCIVLVLSLRAINVLVPQLNKNIVDNLAEGQFPYHLILGYTGVKLLQGGAGSGRIGGWISCLKNIIWINVEQFTVRELRLRLFNHLHRLGVRWHYSRRTGEVLRVMDRGTSSVTLLLDTAFFKIFPIFIDVFVAIGALSYDLNFYFGLIIFATTLVYLIIAVIGAEYRTKFKRSMNEADNDQRARSVDSLLNSETVKLFGNEEYEGEVYQKYIKKFQEKEWMSMVIVYSFHVLQSLVLNAGVLFGSLYCAYLISKQQLTVGDFILFGTYMMQLMQPLNQLIMMYRQIQEAMINMENMFELLDEEEEIKNIPGAIPFQPCSSDALFDNVSFQYSPKQNILNNISFHIPSGSTLGIVGPSGSGKSTIIKLVLRLFDPIDGKIQIGGVNIKDVEQTSLRRSIGVVPQETVLFNETVEYNINYGRIGAELKDIKEAAKWASLHDRIESFPDGYASKVGERGLKLSGGEKQRVAISRAFLRSPLILLLDEATSSLDTETEQSIQESLEKVCKDRTCIVVAHRLSTVMGADKIIVLSDGEIVETGTHEELMNANNIYAGMWTKQERMKTNNFGLNAE